MKDWKIIFSCTIIVLGSLLIYNVNKYQNQITNIQLWLTGTTDKQQTTTIGKKNATTPDGNTSKLMTTLGPGQPITKNNASDNSLNVTIIVFLSGELGNQISKIAFGIGLQHMAKDMYGLDTYSTQLKLRAQPRGGKWKNAMIDTKACFPHLRSYDFRECNTPEFEQLQQEQERYIKKTLVSADPSSLVLRNTKDIEKVHQALQFLQSLTLQRQKDTTLQQQQSSLSSSTIPLPHIYADTFAKAESFMMDLYYKEIKEFFTLDTTVCKAIPESDESVLHIRNFMVEMPKRGKRLGFEELSPNYTATHLFSKLKPGDKIAITSRFTNDEYMARYVKALEERGFVVRLIQGQTGIQDFCFLMKAQKELVGLAMSSYVSIAAVLGDAQHVRLYSVDSLATRARVELNDGVPDDRKFGRSELFTNYNYTNPELKSRISFELYQSEDILNHTSNYTI